MIDYLSGSRNNCFFFFYLTVKEKKKIDNDTHFAYFGGSLETKIFLKRMPFMIILCNSIPSCTKEQSFILTLVFPFPWTTTGKELYAVFLTRTLSVPNLRSTSSAKKHKEHQISRLGLKTWNMPHNVNTKLVQQELSLCTSSINSNNYLPTAPFRFWKIWHLWSRVMLRDSCKMWT